MCGGIDTNAVFLNCADGITLPLLASIAHKSLFCMIDGRRSLLHPLSRNSSGKLSFERLACLVKYDTDTGHDQAVDSHHDPGHDQKVPASSLGLKEGFVDVIGHLHSQ